MPEDEYKTRPADEYSLSHEQIAEAGLSDVADFMDAPDTGWPDDKLWDLGDGVTVTQAQLRRMK